MAFGHLALYHWALGPKVLCPLALGPFALGPLAIRPLDLGPSAFCFAVLGPLALGPSTLDFFSSIKGQFGKCQWKWVKGGEGPCEEPKGQDTGSRAEGHRDEGRRA